MTAEVSDHRPGDDPIPERMDLGSRTAGCLQVDPSHECRIPRGDAGTAGLGGVHDS